MEYRWQEILFAGHKLFFWCLNTFFPRICLMGFNKIQKLWTSYFSMIASCDICNFTTSFRILFSKTHKWQSAKCALEIFDDLLNKLMGVCWMKIFGFSGVVGVWCLLFEIIDSFLKMKMNNEES